MASCQDGHSGGFGVPFVCVSMEILAMFEFPSLCNVGYVNKQKAIDILNIVFFVHGGCIIVACWFQRNKPSKISCLSSNKVRKTACSNEPYMC